jgi:hypothetical protein
MLERVFSFFTSLRLTVFCLACALVLVFAGTLAQVHLGLYQTQERYFHSLFVFWSPPGASWKVPVWPGGYLLGGLLLVNLLAAHAKRFSLAPRKAGLFLIHAGLIMLFVGQFLTESFQVESFMRLEEGETRNYTESARKNELVIVDTTDPARDQIVAIPESRLVAKQELNPPGLPFTVRAKEYFPNSAPAPAMKSIAGEGPRMEASQGIGQRLFFRPAASTVRTDDENVPAALVEIVTPKGSLGSWTVSNWLSRYAGQLRQQLGQLGTMLDAPQQFTYENRTYRLSFRPVRYYLPYSLTLLDFSHKRYKGTDIPKDFSSRIQLRNPQSGEDREVLIYMNNPLRYAGQTFYQGGFEPGDTVSILQVVRNPAWLTPYLSCTLVGIGLSLQFVLHLLNFGKRNTPQARLHPPAPARNGKPRPGTEPLDPAGVTLAAGSRLSTAFQPANQRRNS